MREWKIMQFNLSGIYTQAQQINNTISFNHDVLVLSCALNRLKLNENQNFILTDPSLEEHVTESDIDFKNTILKYYSQKAIVWNLCSKNLSKFREELRQFLTIERKNIEEKFIPIAFSLPNFYREDIQFDSVKDHVNTNVKNFSGFGKKNSVFDLELTLVDIIHKHNFKSRYKIEYWFKDKNNNAYLIKLENFNPLLPLFDRMLELNSGFFVKEGNTAEQSRDGLQFYLLNTYKF